MPEILSPTQGLVPIPDPTTLTNELVRAAIESAVARLDTKIAGLEELYVERFGGIAVRFVELNTRLSEADKYKEAALTAALLSNKESLHKTEELFGKQIDSLAKAVDDLKGAVREGAGTSSGISTTIAWVVAAVSTLAAVGLVIVDMLHK